MASGSTRIGTVLMGGAMLTGVLVVGGVAMSTWRSTVSRPIDDLVPQNRPLAIPAEEVLARASKVTHELKVERDLDRQVLPLLTRDLGAPEKRDLLGSPGPRVDIFQDAGVPVPNRVEVDLDRDGTPDERWETSDPILRRVSPADDGQYTEEYVLDRGGWVPAGERNRDRPSAEAQAEADERVVIDETVLAFHHKAIGAPRLQDVTQGFPFRLAVYQDDGHDVANRARLDLDRDDRWDEEWTLGTDPIERRVSPEDDGEFTETFVRVDGGWVSK